VPFRVKTRHHGHDKKALVLEVISVVIGWSLTSFGHIRIFAELQKL